LIDKKTSEMKRCSKEDEISMSLRMMENKKKECSTGRAGDPYIYENLMKGVKVHLQR
jgi:hypothetical protein